MFTFVVRFAYAWSLGGYTGVRAVCVLAIVQVCASHVYYQHWASGRSYQNGGRMWSLLGEDGERPISGERMLSVRGWTLPQSLTSLCWIDEGACCSKAVSDGAGWSVWSRRGWTSLLKRSTVLPAVHSVS